MKLIIRGRLKMLFNSVEFLIFFPIVTLVYFIVPAKIKHFWLLASSYFFYMCWNAKYALLLFTSTLLTYLSGLLLERVKHADMSPRQRATNKKWIVAICVALNLGILFYFKYTQFAFNLLSRALSLLHIRYNAPTFDIILPVGISFFTFQALSYTIDVYRDDIYAEKNFIRYALFVSFFPQLVAGPIERSKNLLRQIAVPKKFSFDNAREGLLLMLWGYFLKIVLADRISLFVDTVYSDHATYGGYYIVFATILFAVQIYCDFSGYSTIAMGAARVLGIELMENFNAPYLATSIADFWRNWHISLTSWFKDYLYIPLGGNRKGVARGYLNKLIVFFLSGLWHGAAVTYVLWGLLNGVYQIVGQLLRPMRERCLRVLRLNPDSIGHRLLRVGITFVLVDFSWLFFRASNIHEAFHMLSSVFSARNIHVLFDGSLYNCGLDRANFSLMVLGICVLFFADFCKHRGICIRKVVIQQDYWFRWAFIAASVLALLLFGKWGPSFDKAAFIYFQF